MVVFAYCSANAIRSSGSAASVLLDWNDDEG